MKEELFKRVYDFMVKHKVSCTDSIIQDDNVMEGSCALIIDMFEIIEDSLPNYND